MNAAGPVVTLVVPTYRRPELLRECLEAIRGQTFEDFTVLVCDNAADPAVGRLVDDLDDQRFLWTPRETNLGILGNVWSGFSSARTELVMEVDDDDVLAADALALLVPPLLEDPTVLVAFADVDLVDAAGRPLPPEHPMSAIVSRRDVPAGRLHPFHEVAARGDIFMVAAVIRRAAIDWTERPDAAGTAYDRYLAVALARTGAAAHHVARPVVAYRIHEQADGSRELTSQLDGAATVLEAELARGGSGTHMQVVRDELTRTHILRIRSLLADGRPGAAAATAARVLTAPRGLVGSARFARRYLRRILGARRGRASPTRAKGAA
ncbi:glycosyltransferase family 2 protein [Janibacter sp. GS2]|uniref:glycosyltransferase family 2 protein n=1 Tax=Janibacter sp. GS2 TaxID=3442646 RepID=UPI003EB7C097